MIGEMKVQATKVGFGVDCDLHGANILELRKLEGHE